MVLDSELRSLCLCSKPFTDWSSPQHPFQLCFLSELFSPSFPLSSLFSSSLPSSSFPLPYSPSHVALLFFFGDEILLCYPGSWPYTAELRGSSCVSLPSLCMSVPPKFWIVLWKVICLFSDYLIWNPPLPLSLVFCDRVSLCSLSWPRSWYVDHTSLRLIEICLPSADIKGMYACHAQP